MGDTLLKTLLVLGETLETVFLCGGLDLAVLLRTHGVLASLLVRGGRGRSGSSLLRRRGERRRGLW